MAEPAAPGWLPDPERAGVLRWWNGLGWSDARKPVVGGPVVPVAATGAPGPASPPPAYGPSTVAPGSTAGPVASGRPAPPLAANTWTSSVDRTAPAAAAAGNPLSIVGFVLAIISLFFGFIPVLPPIAFLLSVGGIVRSRTLARAGVARTGLVRSVVGLLLASAAIAIWGAAFVDVFSS